jgi:hypothetical protein
MGINKARDPSEERATGSVDSIHSPQSAATNNNGKNADGPTDESSNGFSSLMDIGQAYGIWNPEVDGANFKVNKNQRGEDVDEKEDKEKLVIDEDDDDDDDDEPLSPGGPEEEEIETSAPSQVAETST